MCNRQSNGERTKNVNSFRRELQNEYNHAYMQAIFKIFQKIRSIEKNLKIVITLFVLKIEESFKKLNTLLQRNLQYFFGHLKFGYQQTTNYKKLMFGRVKKAYDSMKDMLLCMFCCFLLVNME
ncbi:hypothetical protein B9Z55_011570 [Caenorhabditis nigoni]|uniref:Uncharacterized protein n=1 Tax=Caenorhabditis nigoni TaxID=1611254 RepID=A0A2G5UKL9_9PELO|nr:hypothetical protein B9Z55_011570 [Caenorhabditis nigoni]